MKDEFLKKEFINQNKPEVVMAIEKISEIENILDKCIYRFSLDELNEHIVLKESKAFQVIVKEYIDFAIMQCYINVSLNQMNFFLIKNK